MISFLIGFRKSYQSTNRSLQKFENTKIKECVKLVWTLKPTYPIWSSLLTTIFWVLKRFKRSLWNVPSLKAQQGTLRETWCFMFGAEPKLLPAQVALCLASNELAQCWHPDRLGGETLFCFVGFWDFIVRCPKSLGVGQVPVFYMFLFVCQKVRVKVVACVCRLLIVVHCCCWTVVGCCCILPGLVVCGCLYAAPWDDPHLVKLIH